MELIWSKILPPSCKPLPWPLVVVKPPHPNNLNFDITATLYQNLENAKVSMSLKKTMIDAKLDAKLVWMIIYIGNGLI